MIFGKTNKEKEDLLQSHYNYLYENRIKVFALFPIKLHDGRWVWLEYVYAKHPIEKTYGYYQYHPSVSIKYYRNEK